MHKERYLREPEQGAMKKRKWQQRTFELAELDFAHPGKMTKRKDDQKVNHKERDIKRTLE